jgi:hypothetical protein
MGEAGLQYQSHFCRKLRHAAGRWDETQTMLDGTSEAVEKLVGLSQGRGRGEGFLGWGYSVVVQCRRKMRKLARQPTE